MKKELHYMIDIETTGVNKKEDSLLEVAMVELEYKYPYWYPTGRTYHRILHYPGQPTSEFAKKHMVELYKKCNEAPVESNYDLLREEMKLFIHRREKPLPPALSLSGETPKLFIGWNASNFDLEFLFVKGILVPSYYQNDGNGKEELRGDVHYRIYEQTGSVQVISDMTGLSRKTLEVLADDLNPTNIELPEGKSHDALYDCYRQIIMQNGLIAIGRSGIRRG